MYTFRSTTGDSSYTYVTKNGEALSPKSPTSATIVSSLSGFGVYIDEFELNLNTNDVVTYKIVNGGSSRFYIKMQGQFIVKQ